MWPVRWAEGPHLEAPGPKTELYEFFENFIRFISTDFILEIKDVPNESDTDSSFKII